jgi:phage shock protein PspC (stress-responsive transcriptional regulator)
MPSAQSPTVLTRSAEGRWVGGVCAGIARQRDVAVGWLRIAFVLAALAGGLGVLVYVACWLIIPGDREADGTRTSSAVVLAQLCAAGVGLVTMAIAASLATVFGYGWIVVAAAAAILIGVLAIWPRVGPAVALLPVAALALPALALATARVHVDAQFDSIRAAPATFAQVPPLDYRSGLGTMLIDLRHTQFPARGNLNLRVRAGIRRTIVALPSNQCVHVHLNYVVHPFARRVADAVDGRGYDDRPALLFGALGGADSGVLVDPRPKTPGPTLNVDFSSAGGPIYVRDYPDVIDPEAQPDWPGYPVFIEQRPDVNGMSKKQARFILAHWRVRYRADVQALNFFRNSIFGPCARHGAPR